jgi:hypothetical protein
MDETHFGILIIKIKNEVQGHFIMIDLLNYCIICFGYELVVTVENIH